MAKARIRREGRPEAAEVGRRFSAWLLERGMTTEAFARATGLHYTTCSALRQGKWLPRDVTKMAIRAVFSDCPLLA